MLIFLLSPEIYAVNSEFVDGSSVCSLKNNGSIACSGNNSSNQSTPPVGNDFTQVSSTGVLRFCALKNNGSLICWGGLPNALPPPSGNDFIQISGECALKTSGNIICWRGSKPITGNNFVQISIDKYSVDMCALKNDGGIVCGGDNTNPIPSPVGNNFVQVSTAFGAACAVKNNGSLICWGSADEPPSGNNFIQVSTGAFFFPSCALKNDGSIVCWGGAERHGIKIFTPTGNNFTQVSVSAELGCALKNNGSMTCWDANNEISTLEGNDFVGAILNTPSAGTTSPETYNNNHLFELAENKFSEFFTPSKSKTLTLDNWEYRYYSGTDTYLGILSENETYVLGGTFGSEIVQVGLRNELIDILIK